MCTNNYFRLVLGWFFGLYDCDFLNQMLDLKVEGKIKHIKDYNEDILQDQKQINYSSAIVTVVLAGESGEQSVIQHKASYKS